MSAVVSVIESIVGSETSFTTVNITVSALDVVIVAEVISGSLIGALNVSCLEVVSITDLYGGRIVLDASLEAGIRQALLNEVSVLGTLPERLVKDQLLSELMKRFGRP